MNDNQIQDLIDETNKPTECNPQLKGLVEFSLWLYPFEEESRKSYYTKVGEELWDKLRPQLDDWLLDLLRRELHYD